jgi:DDE superfamily endonuclease
MFQIVRGPPALDKFFRPLKPRFHWDHYPSFRLLVLVMAFAWGRRKVANLYRYLAAQHQRTRFNNFFLVERWDPEAALRHTADELLVALRPRPGDTIDLVRDDAKQAKRGTAMDAVAKMNASVTDTYIRGHQSGCAILVYGDHVRPYGIRCSVKKTPGPPLGLPFRKTTEWAAPLIREVTPPAGVKVVVRFETYSLCRSVVQACRDQHFHFAATLKSNRNLFKQGWRLTAGRYGKKLLRRRRPQTFVLATPHGQACYRYVDAGWLQVGTLGTLPVVFSRKGSAHKSVGLVTDAPTLSAPHLIQADDRRWSMEPWIKDLKQLLGLGHDQNRAYRAAVTHLHLVCFA